MRKYFKSIVAIMLIVVTLIIISVPAMAVETKLEQESTKVAKQYAVCIGNASGNAYFKGSKVRVATIRLDGAASLLQHKITGPWSEWVHVRLIHQGTGDTRNFTGVSSDGWLSDSYNVPLRSGYWDIYIIGAQTQGRYYIQINAYSVG